MLDELDRRGLASRRLDLGKEAVTAEHDELIRGPLWAVNVTFLEIPPARFTALRRY